MTRSSFLLLLLLTAGCSYPRQWKKEELPTTRVGSPKSPRESRANAARFALITILFGFPPLEH